MRDKEFEDRLARVTDQDAGFRNENDYRQRKGESPLTLDEYRRLLRILERDERQMEEMGR